MRSVVIIILHPLLCQDLHLGNVLKKVGVQDILPESPVKAFDIAVLHSSAWLDILNLNAVSPTLLPEFPADKLRAVISPDPLGFAFFTDDPVQ